MDAHPIIRALFDENSCNPSKQLLAVREQFKCNNEMPTIMIILPPAEQISREIETDILYYDHYLLSHVVDASNLSTKDVVTLNGSHWMFFISKDELLPSRGFPFAATDSLKVTNSFIWTPAVAFSGCVASFFIVEVDKLILSSNSLKKYNWFNSSRSAPNTNSLNPSVKAEKQQQEEESKAPSRRPLNPAHALGRTKAQRDQNMARVDYCLACLQQDVTSSEELAQRFHGAVSQVISTLIEAGGTFVTDQDDIEENIELPPATFTRSSVYDYAEYRLSTKLLCHLEHLLMKERESLAFIDLYKDLQDLDITQVDIPNLYQVEISVFERAVNNAALALDRLSQARNAKDMCQVFLNALNILADPKLGTVSADTLLGLFMLTVLRSSPDCARVLERNLYFVAHFSSQNTDSNADKMSAGRLSYALMVVESVLLQLRLEHTRLLHLTKYNREMWLAIRGDDRKKMQEIREKSPTSLTSRCRGKSVLFMTVEDQNIDLLKYLLHDFSEKFTKQFILRDRDKLDRTLLMLSVKTNIDMAKVFVDFLDNDEIFRDYIGKSCDLNGQNLSFYMSDPCELGEFVLGCLDLEKKDHKDNTAFIYHSKHDNLLPFIPYCQNFMSHIDKRGNSLLHLTVNSPEFVRLLVSLPGCDVNWPNKEGKTALMLTKSVEVSQILLECGADPLIPGQKLSVEGLSRQDYYELKATDIFVRQLLNGEIKIIHNSVVVNKNIRDFYDLGSALEKVSPESWLPPLKSYWSPEFQQGIAGYFAQLLLEQDNVRLSFWIKQLQNHSTFQKSKHLEKFLFPPADYSDDCGLKKTSNQVIHDLSDTILEAEGDKKPEKSPEREHFQSRLTQEDHVSILAFLDLAQRQLHSFRECLVSIVLSLAKVHSLQSETQRSVYGLENSMTVLASLLKTKFLTCHNRLVYFYQTSMLPKLVLTSLTQLIKHSESLELKLGEPAKLSDQLKYTKLQLDQNREKLGSLAEAKYNKIWLSSKEEKRIAEMNKLEQQLASGRQQVLKLETQIASTHYSLASELSAFNEFQENEIKEQLKLYSKGQIQEAKDRLKHLEFAYTVSSV